jgi:hypothetical protein
MIETATSKFRFRELLELSPHLSLCLSVALESSIGKEVWYRSVLPNLRNLQIHAHTPRAKNSNEAIMKVMGRFIILALCTAE